MITQYILFSQLPAGSEFIFYEDDVPIMAIKLNDNAWMYRVSKKDSGQWYEPLEKDWLVQC